MQLICPNCGARYEVDEAMIPPEGRDVQCSNCTTTWFQPGVQQEGAEVAPPPEPPSPAHREPTRPIPVTAEEAPASGRRELDPSVRDVLRAEADRETELRRREGGGLEQQDEMPLEEPAEPADEVTAAISGLISGSDDIGELQDAPRERARDEAAARYEGAGGDSEEEIEAQIAAAAAAGGAAGSRRDLLPDIEEINSTLRATETRSATDPGASDIGTLVERPRRRSGTRIGFALALVVFGALFAVYANASRIAEAFPQVEPVLDSYVAQVDQLRLWIDEIAQGALTSDENASSAAAAPEPAAETPTSDGGTEADSAEGTPSADAPDQAGDENASPTQGN